MTTIASLAIAAISLSIGEGYASHASPCDVVPDAVAGVLDAAVALSPTSAWALGFTNYGTLAQRWDGASWKTVPTPNPPNLQGGFYAATGIPKTNDLWAVGVASDSLGTLTPLIEKWNHGVWLVQPVPNVQGYLEGVSGFSEREAWAVGGSNGTSFSPIALKWDGAAWVATQVPIPAGASGAVLTSVITEPGGLAIAVGFALDAQLHQHSLIERYAHGIWSVVGAPGERGTWLSSLATIPGTHEIWAVGGQHAGRPLILRGNGEHWRALPTQSPHDGTGALGAVASADPSAAIAIGQYYPSDDYAPNPATFVERWDGLRWTLMLPQEAGRFIARGVAAIPKSQKAWLVGSNDFAGTTMIERCPDSGDDLLR